MKNYLIVKTKVRFNDFATISLLNSLKIALDKAFSLFVVELTKLMNISVRQSQ